MTIDRRTCLTVAMAALLSGAGCRGESRPLAPDEAVPELKTPVPSGPHGVGRSAEVTAAGAVVLFYPTPGMASTTTYPAAVMSPGHVVQLTRRFGAPIAQALAAAKGYAVPDAPVAKGAWPLLVFAPGWHLAGQDYRVLSEHIASDGYVVAVLSDLPGAGSNPPYGATADAIASVVDELSTWRGAIDPARIGAFGHSVGGAAAVLAASRHPAIKAAINLDGDYADDTLTARPKQPLLHVLSRTPNEPASSIDRRHRDWRTVRAASTAAHRVQLPQFRHLNFLDAALLEAHLPADRRGRFGEVMPAHGLMLATYLVTAFFDQYLGGRAGAFAVPLAAYPDKIQVLD